MYWLLQLKVMAVKQAITPYQVKKLTKENLNEFIYFDLPKDKIDLDEPGFISLNKKVNFLTTWLQGEKPWAGFYRKDKPQR